MFYDGYVSSRNQILWTFELNNKIVVHMGHLAAYNSKQSLPNMGDHIRITNAHYDECSTNRLFLCKDSTLTCKSVCKKNDEERDTRLLCIIKDYDIGVADILEIDHNISVVKEFIESLSHQSAEEIMLEILSSLANQNKKPLDNSFKCSNRIVPMFSLLTLDRYCNIDRCIKEAKLPEWSFGVHSKIKDSDILLGHLKINKNYGLIFLHDAKCSMPCLITNKFKIVDKNNILNNFVLIKRYCIITEMYRESRETNLEYVLFDSSDAIVLDITPTNNIKQSIFSEHLPQHFPHKYCLRFRVLHKASVSYVKVINESECWLEVDIINNSHSYNSYLCLNSHQIQVLPLLDSSQEYYVYHSEKLKDFKATELFRLKDLHVSQKFIDNTSLFVPIHTENIVNSENIFTVTEVCNKLKCQGNSCVSFQGILKGKRFTRPLSSRTQNNINRKGFGTPGTKTHILIFTNDTRDHEITLYLNNWENLQVPLGLILDMKLCVRNVLPQKSKYLKSTAMTTLEVLDYEPKVFFDTANVNDDPRQQWKKFSFAGLGDLIPFNVLIWIRTVQVFVRSVNIWCVCEDCDKTLLAQTSCVCGSNKRSIRTKMTLFLNDECGRALIISSSLSLLRLLLNFEPKPFEMWCSAFQYIGNYIHNINSLKSSNRAVVFFQEALYELIEAVNATGLLNLVLKCRKLECSMEGDGMPKWFCIDAERYEW